ncbi:hypothetical protein SDC9_131819 [bioreactor metagenome]|uniref:Uncharacterized protein n=1 Tax=bioreactor metagenome TaxID=1076179 RepID=A0A645D726_9ZZZZ
MFDVDECRLAAIFLRFGDHVQCNGCFTTGLRPVNFDDAPARQPANAQRKVQRKAAGGNGIHLHGDILPQLHDGTLAKLLFNLGQCGFQCFGFIELCGFVRCFFCCHGRTSRFCIFKF